MNTWWSILTRRKRLEPVSDASTYTTDKKLARILSTFDLTALGVGSTLGVGVYVIAGQVSKDLAGPSVILSFLIAAVASIFAGLCYAEFGARVPKAGSAYNYSYICVGEFIAFIIGWNLILEYVIGSASVARGLSLYLDTLVNNTLKETFRDIAPMQSSFLSEYFDFFAFAITITLGTALAFGLKESSIANNIFTLINICVVLFVIIAGAFKADGKNWNIDKKDIPKDVNGGEGGFFPFGIAGTIKGAATCFYGFVGFDCIATTAEEVKNPQRAVPIAIILSLLIVFLSYFGTSAIVTLMCPYYLQDPDAPIPHVFEEMGWTVAKWIVSIGGIFGLCASLFGAMFPLPRIVYAMASDGLVFRFLGHINDRFGTLVIGTLLAALLTGFMSAVFNLKQLVNMMSIGTLMAYTIVAACVVILRYSIDEEEIADWRYSLLDPDIDSDYEYNDQIYEENEINEDLTLISPKENVTFGKICKQMFNFSNRKPTYITQKLVTAQVFIFSILALIFAAFMAYLQEDIQSENLWVIIPTTITFFLMVVTLISIYAQPTANKGLTFKVPLVPLIPAVSIAINLYLMMMLDANTWIRFGVWMAVGLPIYFTCCKLYKCTTKKTEHPTTNGHIAHENTNQDNHTLTIPTIVVIPPQNGTLISNEHLQMEPVTNENNYRKSSIDIAEVNEAVSALDKVLDETEGSYSYNSENVEAINKRRCSIISSASESASSEEHHIEAIVHQEDENCEKLEVLYTDTNENLEAESEMQNKENLVILIHENLEEHHTDRGELNINLEANVDVQSKEELESQNSNNTTGTENEELLDKSNTKQSNDHTKEESNDISLLEKPENADNQLDSIIPKPPPISGLLNNTDNLDNPILSPKKSPVLKPPILKPDEIILRSVPRLRKRTESVTSETSVDNVTTGSSRYQKLKTKLDNIFRNYTPLRSPEQKVYLEEKAPSPRITKGLDLFDQVLESHQEEIPIDYGKTKEFKDTLNKLLSRKTSKAVEKPEYVRKYNKNQITENNKQNNEAQHKRLMNETLRSIKLRRTGLLHMDDNEENDQKNTDNEKEVESINELKDENDKEAKIVNDRKTSEIDKEKHKRLMIATLRSIKLRKTGIPLSENNNEIENVKYDDITKEATER